MNRRGAWDVLVLLTVLAGIGSGCVSEPAEVGDVNEGPGHTVSTGFDGVGRIRTLAADADAAGAGIAPMGYGTVRNVLITRSAPGRTGDWWCSNHFANNVRTPHKCRSVSGGHGCRATVPDHELVSCSEYEHVADLTADKVGTTGHGWCAGLEALVGGSWDCISASGGCGNEIADGGAIECGLYHEVSEARFAPDLSCAGDDTRGAEREFCRLTEYTRTRTARSYYLYNDFVRVGVNRSFGGTIFELYGSRGYNLIEEHGGSAIQLSIWGYAPDGPANWYRNGVCDNRAHETPEACLGGAVTSERSGAYKCRGDACCRKMPPGKHQSQCPTERPCSANWPTTSPWNPIQAQAADCGWNGPSNDVSRVEQKGNGVRLTKVEPWEFTRAARAEGLTWSTTVDVPSDPKPYAKVTYTIDYNGISLGDHPQEIPAIFTDNRLGKWHYYSRDNEVRRIRGTDKTHPDSINFPDRENSKWASSVTADENWICTCDEAETNCLTVASTSALVKRASRKDMYITLLGDFASPTGSTRQISVFFFPYKFDAVVGGKSIRRWIRDL